MVTGWGSTDTIDAIGRTEILAAAAISRRDDWLVVAAALTVGALVARECIYTPRPWPPLQRRSDSDQA
jgi:hypothetical protein